MGQNRVLDGRAVQGDRPPLRQSHFKWSGEDGEVWLESGLHTEKDMLVASFPDGGVECSNGSMFINLTYANQSFQLFINVNDWGVPTAQITRNKLPNL